MIGLLAFRSLFYRPWRTVFLFFGYGVGVGVMIVLLSIGEALLDQARDEKLVGGGEITVLPEGLDVELMKTGGIGGLFFSIDHSRFVFRQLLASPRLAPEIRAVSPQIDGRLVYLTTPSGRTVTARATGEIPSATHAVGAAARIAQGSWSDDDGDRRYVSPTMHELRDEIDHFHLPSAETQGRSTWAEWHYFNVVSSDTKSWIFISYIVAGDVLGSRWGGKLGVTVHESDGSLHRYAALVPAPLVRFSTADANLSIGSSTVTVVASGDYHIVGKALSENGDGSALTLDLVVSPTPGAYFPGASLGDREFVSGYVVPALRADATGSVCEGGICFHFVGAQAYHDHNWGVWRGVTWDWGAARAGGFTILYGRVSPPDGLGTAPPLFVYLVDSLGFRAVFRPRSIRYVDGAVIRVDGHSVRVPTVAEFSDIRGGDTLAVRLDVANAIGTDGRSSVAQRGGREAAPVHPYFIQMKGVATLAGRVGGKAVSGSGTGFFETYR